MRLSRPIDAGGIAPGLSEVNVDVRHRGILKDYLDRSLHRRSFCQIPVGNIPVSSNARSERMREVKTSGTSSNFK